MSVPLRLRQTQRIIIIIILELAKQAINDLELNRLLLPPWNSLEGGYFLNQLKAAALFPH